MAIKLASLFIEIGANGDKLTAELSKTTGRARTWSKEIKQATDVAVGAFKTVAIGAGVLTSALTAVYVTNSQSLDQLGKLASQLGDQTDSLRELGLAAEYAGLSSDSMNKNLERMTRRLGDAADGTGPTADAIETLGLNMAELINLRPTEAFEQIAIALEGIESPAQRASIAAALFGRDGLAALNLTADVLQKAKADVEAFGGALTNLEVAQIEAANDSVTRLGAGVSLVADRFTFKMAPAVKSIADALFDSATQSGQLEAVMDRLILGTLSGLSSLAGTTGSILSFIDGRSEIATYGLTGYLLFGKKGFAVGAALGSVSGSVKDTFVSLAGYFDDSTSALERTNNEIDRLESKLKLRGVPGFDLIFSDEGDANIQKRIDDLRALAVEQQGFASASIAALSDTGSLASTFAGGFEQVQTEIDKVIASYGQLSDVAANDSSLIRPGSFKTQSDAGGFATTQLGFSNEITAYQTYQDSRIAAIENSEEIERDIRERELNDSLLQYGYLLDAYQQYQDSRTDIEATKSEADLEADRLKRLDEIRKQYFSRQEYETQRFENTITLFQASGASARLRIAANETKSSLATLAQHSRTMFEINKAVGLANATVFIAQGISRALTLPFPSNILAGAKVALEGAAQIKTITSAKYGKGDVSTPGSSGSASAAAEPVSNVGSVNSSSIAANDDTLQQTPQQGLTVMAFHTPGASEEQREEELAIMLQTAQDNDLLVPDGNGGFSYTGTGSLSGYQRPEYQRTA